MRPLSSPGSINSEVSAFDQRVAGTIRRNASRNRRRRNRTLSTEFIRGKSTGLVGVRIISIEYIRQPFHDLWSEGRGPVLVLLAMGWFLSLGSRLVFPALLPFIQSDFGMSLSLAGLLISVLWFAYGAGQFPGGVLGDRFGERTVLTVSTLCSSVALTTVTLSGTTGMLFVSTVLFGLSTALYGPIRITLLSNIYSERDGIAIGITLAAGNLGNTILPVVTVFLAATYVWQIGFGAIVPLFLVVSLGLWLTIPAELSEGDRVDSVVSLAFLERLWVAIRDPSIAVVTVVQTIGALIIQSFTGFFPIYLTSVKGFSPNVTAGIFGLFFGLGLLVQPFSGSCADRFGPRRTLVVVFSLITAGLVALPLISSVWGIVALTGVLGSIHGFGPVTLKYLTNSLPRDVRSSGFGLLRSGYFMLAAAGPVLVGVLADFGYFDEAFVILGGLAGTAIVLSLLIPRE